MRARSRSLKTVPGRGPGVDQCGFSLVELLIAMAVLAVLAAASFRGLNSILDAEAHVQSETRRWNEAAVLVAQMGRDLSLAIARPVRDGAGRARAALIMGNLQNEAQGQLMITRLGDEDGVASQGDVRRVGYRARAGVLEYMVWPAADAAPNTAPTVSPVLGNVTDLQLRALGPDGSWTSVWPAGQLAIALPRAIEAQIVFAGGERITRIFPLQ